MTTGTLHRLVRARLARAAAVVGDLETARSALAGLELEDDEADASLLLAQGNLRLLHRRHGRLPGRSPSEARERLRGVDDPWHLVDLVGLQGLLAHQRGEWFDRASAPSCAVPRVTSASPARSSTPTCAWPRTCSTAASPMPRSSPRPSSSGCAPRQAGALRGVAFATALIGEAALMMGDLARAEVELVEAVELHADIDAVGGQAHSLQRLAELRLAQGRHEEASGCWTGAAAGALVHGGLHLLQRIFGTLIGSAARPAVRPGAGRPGREHPGRDRPVPLLHGDARRPRSDRLCAGRRPRGGPPLPGRRVAVGVAVGGDVLAGGGRRGRGDGGAWRRVTRSAAGG